jgi:hypothetical protein
MESYEFGPVTCQIFVDGLDHEIAPLFNFFFPQDQENSFTLIEKDTNCIHIKLVSVGRKDPFRTSRNTAHFEEICISVNCFYGHVVFPFCSGYVRSHVRSS